MCSSHKVQVGEEARGMDDGQRRKAIALIVCIMFGRWLLPLANFCVILPFRSEIWRLRTEILFVQNSCRRV